jgi:bacteriocin-like protein|tara:strand:- start:767 stop:1033 length:267 start_codon:yes stop_codon:yes gene_type:complete
MAEYKTVLLITPCLVELSEGSPVSYIKTLSNEELQAIAGGFQLEYEDVSPSYVDALQDLKIKLEKIHYSLKKEISNAEEKSNKAADQG